MRKELWLAVGTTLLTLVLGLLAVRWLAPQLFGVPVDLRMVGVDETRVPFFEMLFRQDGIGGPGLLSPDPLTVNRGTALIEPGDASGPHDLAGFRNLAIPNTPDVVVIGDSQTYGAGVSLGESWPHALGLALQPRAPGGVYSMALGGWSGPQYLYMLEHALRLRPRAIVVAFYVGNDPIEAYVQVYGTPRLAEYRHPSGVTPESPPPVEFPAPREAQWRVNLPGDRWPHFTPQLRRINVMAHPAADDGWRILGEMAAKMAALARSGGSSLYFTIIPTREYVYAPLLRSLAIEEPPEYAALVAEEAARIEAFSRELDRLTDAGYVDVVAALQATLARGERPYPNGVDGHPNVFGHRAIAQALQPAVSRALPALPCGAFRWQHPTAQTWHPGWTDGRSNYWTGSDPLAPGDMDLPALSMRDLASLVRWSSRDFLPPGRDCTAPD